MKAVIQWVVEKRRNSAFLLVGLLAFTRATAAAPPKRIHSAIQANEVIVSKGHLLPDIARGFAQDLGEVASTKVMPHMGLHFEMTPAQQVDLSNFLAALQNRRSPQFHKFLTPEQYATRFGMNASDLERIKVWLESYGFTNVETARGGTWMNFDGTAGMVRSAFHTAIHNYLVNGGTHFANAGEPELPKALSGIVAGVWGLHNIMPEARSRSVQPRFTSNLSGNTFLAPDDWATIYNVKPLYGAGLDGSPIANPSGNYCAGSPCSIVVIGRSDVLASDLANFRSAAGLPAKPPFIVVPPNDNDPGFSSGDERESDLDLEWAGAIAKNGNILFVTADNNPHNGTEDAIVYAIDNNVAPILSTSYGLCELRKSTVDMTFLEGLYAQANAQGMTVVSATGDHGAADCDGGSAAVSGLAVDYPAASTYVTGVGGTAFSVGNVTGTYWNASNNANGGSAVQYIPEGVWNDTSLYGTLAAGGGGVSIYRLKPSWQTGLGVPNDVYRDVPDIALTASPSIDGLLVCEPSATTGVTTCTNGFRNSDSNLNVIGGTSAGAPTFAGVLALLVQKNGARLGNVNPNLYALAQISQTAFHDITSGSNIVPCTIGTSGCTTGTLGYAAGVGYDQASGLGSIDAYNLVEQWSADIEVSSNPIALSIPHGSSQTATITVSPYKNFTGTVSFACTTSSSLVNVTCSVPGTTVATSGTTTVTVTAASNAGTPGWRRHIRNLPPANIEWFLLGLLVAAGFALFRKRRIAQVWGPVAFLALLLGLVSCGGGSAGGSSNTGPTWTPESGTVTVTATSGQIVNSVSIAITIS